MNCNTYTWKRSLTGLLASVLFLAGCTGLGSMEKEIEAMGLEATPEPLILRGNQVELEISGKFPAKYFGKKVSIEATPVGNMGRRIVLLSTCKVSRGKTPLETIRLFPTNQESHFSYSSAIPFDPAMEDASELAVQISGRQGNKSASF